MTLNPLLTLPVYLTIKILFFCGNPRISKLHKITTLTYILLTYATAICLQNNYIVSLGLWHDSIL